MGRDTVGASAGRKKAALEAKKKAGARPAFETAR
jgi:hypothetical protein